MWLVGHDALCCYHHFDHSYQADERVATTARMASYPVDTNWYADFGATDHITFDLDRLTMKDKYKVSDQVQVTSGSGLSISHLSQYLITGSSCPLILNKVLHVPSINEHLVSVHKLTYDNNAFIEFYLNSFFVKDRTMKKILFQGRCKGGHYPLSDNGHVLKP